MARAGWALALVAVLPLLAGCLGPGNATTDEPVVGAGLSVAPAQVEAGSFYAFHHAGGTLSLGVRPGGRAQVELFDGADQRLGQLTLSDALAGGSLDLQGMPAGDYVVRVLAVSGTLRIASAGAAPALRPLAGHVERHILLQAPRGTTPVAVPPGLPGSEPPVERPLDLTLLRAPVALRILAAGDYSSLDVELDGALGPVAVAHASGNPFLGPIGPNGFLSDVGTEFHGENVRDGHLTGAIHSQDLSGVVVLEAVSYSRAEPLAPADPVAPTTDAARFSYGTLPDHPVRFQTGPRTARLLLHANPVPGVNRTWAALFDGHGARLATVSAAPGTTIAIPVSASTDYVAVRLVGNATLGADAPPADFELHALRTDEQVVPARGAGSNGDYAQEASAVGGAHVYAVVPTFAEPSQGGLPFTAFQPCTSGGTVRLAQGNETLDAWGESRVPGFGRDGTSDAALRLRDAPIQVIADGFGGANCAWPAARIRSFSLS